MQLSIVSTQTMSSREIAQLIEKQHSHIKISAERLEEKGVIGTLSVREFIHNGNTYTEYLLNKRDSLILVAQNCPQFTARIVDRWQELEAQQKPSFSLPNFMNPAEAARAWALEFEAKLVAIEERDHAVKTKMQISDKKTATAMATASAAVRETNKLKEQLGFCSKQATVIAVEKATHQKFNWTKLKAWCKQNNNQPVSVPDARFGEAKAWPAGAWLDCYGIDLTKLFKR